MLWFGGAYMDTTVFVNGTEVGQWKYGYTSFWFDITDEDLQRIDGLDPLGQSGLDPGTVDF